MIFIFLLNLTVILSTVYCQEEDTVAGRYNKLLAYRHKFAGHPPPVASDQSTEGSGGALANQLLRRNKNRQQPQTYIEYEKEVRRSMNNNLRNYDISGLLYFVFSHLLDRKSNAFLQISRKWHFEQTISLPYPHQICQ